MRLKPKLVFLISLFFVSISVHSNIKPTTCNRYIYDKLIISLTNCLNNKYIIEEKNNNSFELIAPLVNGRSLNFILEKIERIDYKDIPKEYNFIDINDFKTLISKKTKEYNNSKKNQNNPVILENNIEVLNIIFKDDRDSLNIKYSKVNHNSYLVDY
ncbi:hypothetical protein [Myroides sp.]|uniref:hypothetical protein n=1 Tax=Myroides sp. TaxID=1874736 RepID=UPI003F409FAD